MKKLFYLALFASLWFSSSIAHAQLVSSLYNSSSTTGTPVYVQTGYGPKTTGANTITLMGAPALYYFGNTGAVPNLRCDYTGQTYHGRLKGNYELAAVTPGNVVAIFDVGGNPSQVTIGNLLAGTPGAWWDADADIVCVTASLTAPTVLYSATISYQAASNVSATAVVGRGGNVKTITATNGLFTVDLRRTFTNANNTMQIETMSWEWVR